MVNLELEKKIKQINSYLAVVDSNQKSIALALGFIELNNLFSPDFVSMNDFTRKTFNFNRRKTWQYLKFCYSFCEIRKENKFQAYYVKRKFCEYSFSKLCLCFYLSEDDFDILGLSPQTTQAETKKRVNEFLGLGTPQKVDKGIRLNSSAYLDYNVNRYDCYFDNFDHCYISGVKNPKSIDLGFQRLRDNIIRDNDNYYVVLRVPKKEFPYADDETSS